MLTLTVHGNKTWEKQTKVNKKNQKHKVQINNKQNETNRTKSEQFKDQVRLKEKQTNKQRKKRPTSVPEI